MLPANAQPWIEKGEIVGFWLLLKEFPDGVKTYRYKRIQGLMLEDFMNIEAK